MLFNIPEDWGQELSEELNSTYFKELSHFLDIEYSNYTCYPSQSEVFDAFKFCPLNEVKVVIIGQDPYINPGEAHGLCFSIKESHKFPPSLKNIFKELESDVGVVNKTGDLTSWAKQGVLLLNSTLTVRAGKSNSHAGKGWEKFTSQVINLINSKRQNVVYLLWGNFAIKKASVVNAERNLVLTSVHPSPLSAYRGFFGSAHFSKTNEYLESLGVNKINWKL